MGAKVLIVVLAETRAHELTFDLFKTNLLDWLNADLVLCVGDGPREVPSGFYTHAKYVWKHHETGDWAAAFDDYAGGRDWRCLLPLRDQWLGGIQHPTLQHPGSGGLLLFYREFLRRKLQETKLLEQYDWLILTRSDFMWPVPHPRVELCSPDCVYFPDGERYKGFTDRHILVPKRHFARFLELTTDVFEHPEDLARRMGAVGRSDWNIESFIKFRFGELGLLQHVHFFPYPMYLVRAPDGSTRWSTGTYSHESRFFIKYPDEFNSARMVQALVAQDDDWKYLIGGRRFTNWRMYAYALMRTASERHLVNKRLRFLRLAKRFFRHLFQPIER